MAQYFCVPPLPRSLIPAVAPAPLLLSITSISPLVEELKVGMAVVFKLVAAIVLGVVAPTVPLMLIDAVPVRFVTVPLAGVPRIAPLPSVATPVTPSVLLIVMAPVIETVVPLS